MMPCAIPDLMDEPFMTCPLKTPADQLKNYLQQLNEHAAARPVEERLQIAARMYEVQGRAHDARIKRLTAEAVNLRAELHAATAASRAAAERFSRGVAAALGSGSISEEQLPALMGGCARVPLLARPELLSPSDLADAAVRLLERRGRPRPVRRAFRGGMG